MIRKEINAKRFKSRLLDECRFVLFPNQQTFPLSTQACCENPVKPRCNQRVTLPPMTNIDFHKNLFQYYGVVEPWFYTVTQELICYFATDLETLHSMNDRSLNPLLLIFQLQFSCTLDIRCEHVFDNILNVEKLTCLLLNSLFSKDKIVVSFDKINKIFAENHNSRFYSRSILIKRHLFVA